MSRLQTNSEFYTTPGSFDVVLSWLEQFRGKTFFEPFPGPANCLVHDLEKKGFNFIFQLDMNAYSSKAETFWKNCDLVVTNPPFDTMKCLLQCIITYKRPAIVVMPVSVLTSAYFHRFFKEKQSDICVKMCRPLKYYTATFEKTNATIPVCFFGFKIPNVVQFSL